MVSTCERSFTVVTRNKPKMLHGLSQHGTVVGAGADDSPAVDPQHHRRIERTSPTRWPPRNTVSPLRSLTGRQPQGTPMAQRVPEGGKSERRALMGRIGGAPVGNITPRERGQTFTGSFRTRELD